MTPKLPKASLPYPRYQDHSGLDSATIQQRRRDVESELARKLGGGPTDSFPVILHLLLEEAEARWHSPIVSWQPHGRAFRIHSRKRFEKEVLPLYFQRQSMFTSFQRQLNNYGFLLLYASDKKCYYHEKLLRGKSDLAVLIQRQSTSVSSVRRRLDSTTEPDLSAMVPMPHSTGSVFPSNSRSELALLMWLDQRSQNNTSQHQSALASQSMVPSLEHARDEDDPLSHSDRLACLGSNEYESSQCRCFDDQEYDLDSSSHRKVNRRQPRLRDSDAQPLIQKPIALTMPRLHDSTLLQFAQPMTASTWNDAARALMDDRCSDHSPKELGDETSPSAGLKTTGLSDSEDSWTSPSPEDDDIRNRESPLMPTAWNAHQWNQSSQGIHSTSTTNANGTFADPRSDTQVAFHQTMDSDGLGITALSSGSQGPRHQVPNNAAHPEMHQHGPSQQNETRSEHSPVPFLALPHPFNVAVQEQAALESAERADPQGVATMRVCVSSYLGMMTTKFDRRIEETLGKDVDPDVLSIYSCSSDCNDTWG